MIGTRKIMEPEKLSSVLGGYLERPQKVVMCHGVFDVLHPGHIAHLTEAKAMGDVLVVSVTSDRYVNKGPGRPVFNQQQRMEQLAALEVVDYVVLSDSANGWPKIFRFHPDIFVKGSDWADKGFTELHGCYTLGIPVAFTSGSTDSSSRVSSRAFATYPEETEKWLEGFRGRHTVDDVLGALDSIKEMRVLVVGEHIIDRYTFVDTLAKSPREHHMSVRWVRVEEYACGSVAIEKRSFRSPA